MNTSNIKDYSNEEIEIGELFSIIWKRKYLILLITIISSIFSIFYSLSLPNIYTSSTVMSPQQGNESISNSLGSYSSLAGLVGVNIPQSAADPTIEAMERVKSLDFYKNEFLPYINLENLMAVKNWNPKNNKIEYIESEYDAQKDLWIRDVSYPRSIIPSAQESHSKYKQSLTVTQDKNSNFVTISISHESPYIAKKWVEIIVSNINNLMQKEKIIKSQSSIKFLNDASNKNNIADIDKVFSELLKTETQKLMLASSSQDFIFKVIEPPYAPEVKSSPRRSLICIFGTLIGFMIGVFFTLFYHIFYRK